MRSAALVIAGLFVSRARLLLVQDFGAALSGFERALQGLYLALDAAYAGQQLGFVTDGVAHGVAFYMA